MSIVAASAARQKAVQSIQVSVAAVSASTYDAAGTDSALSINNTPATSQATVYRDSFGAIFGVRKDNSGALLSVPKRLDRASQVFEFLFEGLSTGAGEVGDKDNG